MAKKQFVCIIDTETTISEKVVDFGAVVVDRKGKVYAQCAVLLGEYFLDEENHQLFYDYNSPVDSIWNKASIQRRRGFYNDMLKAGSRMLASANSINRWLEKVAATYDPYLTAYNLAFDLRTCKNTAIDLTLMPKRFCLWGASADRWAATQKYKNFAMSLHAFNNVTSKGNMTYKANAETMARFVLGLPDLPDELHTALEDVIDYELPILVKLLKGRKLSDLVGLRPPGWQQMQVRDHFEAKKGK